MFLPEDNLTGPADEPAPGGTVSSLFKCSLNVHMNMQQIRIEPVLRMLRLQEQALEARAESIVRFYERL